MKHEQCELKIHGSVLVGPKGQVVIPKEVRNLLHIESGDSLIVMSKNDIAVGFIKADNMQAFLDYMKQEIQS